MPETLSTFAERRRDSWADLAGLIDAAGGRAARLDPTSVRRLGLRYREAVADLALARRRFPSDPITGQLDDLVRQARPLVYEHVTERASLGHFVTTGYWRRVRERPTFLLVSALALWAPLFAVALWATANPAEASRAAQITPLTAGLADGNAPETPTPSRSPTPPRTPRSPPRSSPTTCAWPWRPTPAA